MVTVKNVRLIEANLNYTVTEYCTKMKLQLWLYNSLCHIELYSYFCIGTISVIKNFSTGNLLLKFSTILLL